MDFINRQDELERLDQLIASPEGGLAVVYGRRRIGKTRLLLEWCERHGGLYTVADQSAAAIQRRYFAEAAATRLPGFADVEYPDWRALLTRLAREADAAGWRGPIVFDELPYLVVAAPELPSVLQRFIDHEGRDARLVIALAGSSQRMMQGLALAGDAPLYGRARTILDVGPIEPTFLPEVFGELEIFDQIETHAAWGGVPRYWELAAELPGDVRSRLDRLVLDPRGPLHREPDRMLIEEFPPAVETRPVLDAIGSGAHRISEIAGRLGRPATSMVRPIDRLRGMGLVRREIPFGESEKKSRRGLYKIADPFFRLWFRVVAPHRGQLTSSPPEIRRRLLERHFPALVAEAWEELCRMRLPFTDPASPLGPSGPWGPASRFWRGNAGEWDLVAESFDGERLLLGEVKWRDRPFDRRSIDRLVRALDSKAPPQLRGKKRHREIVRALFVPQAEAIPTDGPVRVVEGREILGFRA